MLSGTPTASDRVLATRFGWHAVEAVHRGEFGHMTALRGTDIEKAHIGMDLFGPEPDFGALARSMGVWGEGPIDNPKDVRGALQRALEVVKSGKPALIDTVTQHR